MAVLQKMVMKKALKSELKKKGVTKEKEEAILEAFNAINMDALLSNPDAFAELMSNPAKLMDYVSDDKKPEAVQTTSDTVENSVES